MAVLTHVYRGFPQVSSKPIPGYCVDQVEVAYGNYEQGIFISEEAIGLARATMVECIAEKYVRKSVRIAPVLANFSWTFDYILYYEEVRFVDDKLVHYDFSFVGTYTGNGRGDLYRRKVEFTIADPVVTLASSEDPRLPLLLEWMDVQKARKAARQPVDDIRSRFPNPHVRWCVEDGES